jgi:hypothetical protein
VNFEWDENKDKVNQETHHVSFEEAKLAFQDPQRVFQEDSKHSESEARFFCHGLVNGRVLTVRFTLRGENIRIFGAAHWRQGVSLYESQNRKT